MMDMFSTNTTCKTCDKPRTFLSCNTARMLYCKNCREYEPLTKDGISLGVLK